MLRQTIRSNTFETNSSSAHSMVIIPDSQLQAWEDNKLYYMRWDYGDANKKLIIENNGSRLFTEEFLKSHELFSDAPKEDDFDDLDEFEDAYIEWEEDAFEDFVNAQGWDRMELEEDHTEFTTPNGEKIHILCKYGYDG